LAAARWRVLFVRHDLRAKAIKQMLSGKLATAL